MRTGTITFHHSRLYSSSTTLNVSDIASGAGKDEPSTGFKSVITRFFQALAAKLNGLNRAELERELYSLSRATSADDCDAAFKQLKTSLSDVSNCALKREVTEPDQYGCGKVRYVMEVGEQSIELKTYTGTLSDCQRKQFIRERIGQRLKEQLPRRYESMSDSAVFKRTLRRVTECKTLENMRAVTANLTEQANGDFRFECMRQSKYSDYIVVIATVNTEANQVSEEMSQVYIEDEFFSDADGSRSFNKQLRQKRDSRNKDRLVLGVRDGTFRG